MAQMKTQKISAHILLVNRIDDETLIQRVKLWRKAFSRVPGVVVDGDRVVVEVKGFLSKFSDEYRVEVIQGLGGGVMIVATGKASGLRLIFKLADNILVVQGEVSWSGSSAAKKFLMRISEELVNLILYGEEGKKNVPLAMKLMRIPWQFG